MPLCLLCLRMHVHSLYLCWHLIFFCRLWPKRSDLVWMSCLATPEHKLDLQHLTAQYIFIIWRHAIGVATVWYSLIFISSVKNLLNILWVFPVQSSLTQPQMMVVSDLDDIFVPLPDDLLVNLSESRSVVETFLDSLPSMFQDNVNVESAFGPALKAAFMVMVC